MAARRRSAASRSRARSTPSTRTPAKGSRASATPKTMPRANRDGKYPVSCPRCSAKYNVPEEYLDTVVNCKQCKTAFTPRNNVGHGGGKAARRKKGAGAGGGLLKVGFILAPFVLLIIVYNMVQPEKKAATKAPPIVPTLGVGHPAFEAFSEFCTAIEKKNEHVIAANLDWDHIYSLEKDKSAGLNWKLVQDKQAYIDAFIAKLWEKPIKEAFREHGANLREFNSEIEMPKDRKEVTFTLEFANRENRRWGFAKIEGHVKLVDGAWKVEGWKVIDIPMSVRDQIKRRPYRKKHKTLKKPKYETVKIKDKKIKTYQGKIVRMDHLDDTPPELRKKIDKLIALVFTPSDDPGQAGRAVTELQDLGKPAVPRIMNALYEHQCKTQVEREAFNMLVKTYNNIVGSRISFLPDTDVTSTFGGTDEDRKKLIKAVFGNWYFHYHQKAKDFAGETDEELDKAFFKGSGSPRRGKKRRK